jgi:TatD DNase family protein
MFVDSHCHLDFPELAAEREAILALMRENGVTHALTISTTLQTFPAVLAVAESNEHIFASAGVHPDEERDGREASLAELIRMADHPKVVAIGETGLDYYRLQEPLDWQRDRFRTHIRAARETGKPLVIHTRNASEDTLRIMAEEKAGEAGGVMHCFTETLDVAQRAIDLGFHISFSGIVTFKNAVPIKDVARAVPLERTLIETDSPYLAPTPYRGKTNQPGYVKHVAEEIARLKEIALEEVGRVTTGNFFALFKHAKP